MGYTAVKGGLEAGHPSSTDITAELSRIAADLESAVAAELSEVASTRVHFENF